MLIDDEGALRDWLVNTLEPLCDAEPEALARYVLALVSKDKPMDKLRENCIDRLDVFLALDTTNFVDQLFDVIRNRRYIPEGKKENVQPKASESRIEPSEATEPAKEEEEEEQSPVESHPIPITTTTSTHSPVKRRHSSRGHSDRDHYDRSSSKRHLASSSPPAKRPQRSYSHSSGSSSPPPSRSTTHSSNNRPIPCTEFFDNSASAPNNVDQPTFYPYEASSSHLHQPYNPEAPDLDYNPHASSSMYPQRTLVTVVTNAEPLSADRSNARPMSQRLGRTKRHVITTSYPSDQQRPRKRPWQKSNGSSSNSNTLEIRKIPVEFNTISKLNEHFSKFGTVTNVQIAYDGSPDSALIAYGTFDEAETAYKNPEPLFNNRFIKIFWHKNNKPNLPPSSTAAAPPADAPRPIKKPAVIPPATKLHWSNASIESGEAMKKKTTLSTGPSIIKKEAAKKAALEIRRKKTGLLGEQIQQQKLLLKKFETAETNEEKESIRSLMKQIDATIIKLKDSIRSSPIKSAPVKNLTPQDLLRKRAELLQKQLETLRAKTSADMRRAITNTIETNRTSTTETQVNVSSTDAEEERLLAEPLVDEIQLFDS